MRRVLSVVPLVAALLAPGIVRAQATREITGKVVQAGTNTPLADATVGLFGQPAGVRTNEKGEYRIRVPQEEVTLLVRASPVSDRPDQCSRPVIRGSSVNFRPSLPGRQPRRWRRRSLAAEQHPPGSGARRTRATTATAGRSRRDRGP